MKLEGRTVLVTGGGAGIGLAFAAELLARKNTVIAIGRSADRLEAAKRQLPGLHTLVCDVADPAAVAALAATLERDYPKLDVLVNNAAVALNWDLHQPADPTAELAINLAGPILLTGALLPLLRRNAQPAIVNVGSALAHVPNPMMPIYCATKAALHSYTTSLRLQLAPAGVAVYEIQPPSVATEGAGANTYKPITPEACARGMVEGLERDEPVVRIGQARFLHLMSRVAPKAAVAMLAKGMAD